MKAIKSTILLLTLFAAGCSTIPLTSMYKLMNLNPINVAAKEVVVIAETPKGIEIREGDITLNFSFKTDNPQYNFSHQFIVKHNKEYVVPDYLVSDLMSGHYFRAFQLSVEDAEIMQKSQQLVKRYRSTRSDGAGSFNLSVKSACRDLATPLHSSELNIFVKMKSNEKFFPLFEGLDIAELKGVNGLKNLPLCKS